MIKKIALLSLVFTLTLTSCDVLQQVATTALEKALTNDDIGNGLKEALSLGISKGSDVLSQKGGYFKSAYKILLPAEARQVTDRLRVIPGFNKVEDIVLEKINAGAEDAAAKAKPIFVNAIKQMTISDALNILMGDKNAATEYLKRTTYQQLYSEFNPVIVTSLDKFEARKYWGDAVNTYNKMLTEGNGTRNYLYGLNFWPISHDVTKYYTEAGQYYTYHPTAYNNPFWLAENNGNYSHVNRFIVNQSLTYEITPNFSIVE